MKTRLFRSFRCFALIVVAIGCVTSVESQTPAAAAPTTNFPYELGRAVTHPRNNLEVVYTLAATQPLDSKLTGQRIRLAIEETGMRDVTLPNGSMVQQQRTASRSVEINTGKFKTVAQLDAIVRDIFRKYMSVFTLNLELGKVGSIKYGGELHFMASGDALRFVYLSGPSMTVDTADAFSFKRSDVQVFLGLLEKLTGTSR